MPTWKIAAVQMDIALGDSDANLAAMLAKLRETAAAGARLAVFPECALTGYCFTSLEEAMPHGQPLPGPAVEAFAAVCRELNVFAVFGLLEAEGERLFNAAALVGPKGLVGSYRKIHLPYLGVDRFTTPGNRPFAVHEAEDLRIGMNICYDGSFPESSRVMALAGADLIVLPTNWPPGAETTADHAIPTRALENAVYYCAVDRVGRERGFRFIGKSRICDIHGNVLAEADHTEPAVLYAEIDPAKARSKRIVRVANEHIIDRFEDRRPEMYAPLAERPNK